ncbi:MAG: hypothetical protein ACE5HV_00225 [Acidobacteriota bacterium]
MTWKLTLLLGVLVIVSACEFLGIAKQKGAEFYDKALTETEWFMCNAASIGSIKRRYGTDPERAKTYNDLCALTGAGEIIAPTREIEDAPSQ